MNFIYPLGSGSAWGDMELNLSINLLRKHYKGKANIIVSGDTPRMNVDADLILKTSIEGSRYIKSTHNIEQAAIMLREPFAIMNDDFMCFKEFYDLDIKLWYDGTIKERMQKSNSPVYIKTLHLSQANKDDLNFAVHRPILIDNLDVFFESVSVVKKISCSLRNLYGNRIHENRAAIKDLKIDRPIILDGIDWFSISDRFVKFQENKKWLLSLM